MVEIMPKGTIRIDLDNSLFNKARTTYSLYYLDIPLWKVRGVGNDDKAKALCGLLLGAVQVKESISESEYCDELKEILSQGYFEIEYLDGALIKRVDIPKDWKPTIYDPEKYEVRGSKPYIPTKWERVKDWFVDYALLLLSVGGFVSGIVGLLVGLLS